MDIGKEVVRLIDRLESEKKSGDEIIGIIREKIENPEELKQENDMKELTKVYATPSMFNDIEIFTKPILKTAMDCIRLIHYLERREKQCKESKH